MHIYILGPKLLLWNFFKSLSYLYEVVHTNFSADFFQLSQLLTTIVAPSSDEYENYVLPLKGRSLPKKQ